MNQKKIEASLLSCDISKLQEELNELKINGINLIHYDVMDNKFVNNTAFDTTYLKPIYEAGLKANVHFMVMKPFA